MKLTVKRLTAALLVLCLLSSLAGCGGGDAESSAPVTSTTNSAPTGTTTTTAAPVEGDFNPLTGEMDMLTDNNRPIGFIVTDETSRVTQLNLETADLYIEAETEAGIPRILAIFSSVDRIPDTIGPVRSSRPHFVKIAAAMDMLYCHIGGSITGLSYITKYGVDNLRNAYEKNEILKNSDNVSWNVSAFTKQKVMAEIANRGRETTTDNPPELFQFGDKAGTQPAETVNVKISEAFDMAFTYDSATSLYLKHRNSLDTAIHNTYTGGPISASNVIVMYAKRFVDTTDKEALRYDFELTEGKGMLAVGGKARDIVWKMSTDTGLKFYESDGTTPLTVATGKTFICLTGDHLASKTEVY